MPNDPSGSLYLSRMADFSAAHPMGLGRRRLLQRAPYLPGHSGEMDSTIHLHAPADKMRDLRQSQSVRRRGPGLGTSVAVAGSVLRGERKVRATVMRACAHAAGELARHAAACADGKLVVGEMVDALVGVRERVEVGTWGMAMAKAAAAAGVVGENVGGRMGDAMQRAVAESEGIFATPPLCPRASSVIMYSCPSRMMCASWPMRILTRSSLRGVLAGLAGAAEAPPEDIIKPKGS